MAGKDVTHNVYKNEVLRLVKERIYPLNKSNTKYVKVGYSVAYSFGLRYVLWDIPTNTEIQLDLHELLKVKMFILGNPKKTDSLELEDVKVTINRTKGDLVHFIENETFKMLTFHMDTLKYLVDSKQIFCAPLNRHDLNTTMADILDTMRNKFDTDFADHQAIKDGFENILIKMPNPDRGFLAELVYKFPITLMFRYINTRKWRTNAEPGQFQFYEKKNMY